MHKTSPSFSYDYFLSFSRSFFSKNAFLCLYRIFSNFPEIHTNYLRRFVNQIIFVVKLRSQLKVISVQTEPMLALAGDSLSLQTMLSLSPILMFESLLEQCKKEEKCTGK
jgi:hypothetical protein